MAITHSTAADASMSEAGKAAWNADHTGTWPAGDVTFTQSGSGVSLTVQEALRNGKPVSIREFLTAAQWADVVAGTAAEDVTSAITTALATLDLAGTATYSSTPTKSLFCPAGIYKFSSAIEIPKNCQIVGEGKNSTIFSSAHTGNGFTTTSPIDTSTNINVSLRDLAIWNSNGSNTGAGYVDLGGTQINLSNVQIKGFKYNIIFDQSELAYVDLCDLEVPLTGGIWLVNGPERTPGADAFYTNRITVSRSQLSSTNAGTAIIDDGGYTHAFVDNNYNGWTNHIRAAGVSGLRISGGQFEGATSTNILIRNTTLGAGTAVGYPVGIEIGGGLLVVPQAAQSFVNFGGGGPVVLGVMYLGSSSADKFTGISNVTSLTSWGVHDVGGGGNTFDGTATYHWHLDTATGIITNSVTFGSLTVSGTTALTGATTVTQTGNALLIKHATGDQGIFETQAAGGGLLWKILNAAATDYEPLTLDAETFTLNYRTGVGTKAAAFSTDTNGSSKVSASIATPAGGSTAARLLFGTTAGFGIYYGSGAPTVSAAQGSLYIRSDGSSTTTRLYVNTDGGTTWTNFSSAA